MKLSYCVFLVTDSTKMRRNLFPVFILLCIVLFIGSALILNYKEQMPAWDTKSTKEATTTIISESRCEPSGSESLPRGIVRKTSNLEMQTLGGSPHSLKKKGKTVPSMSLLAIAVGIKQKNVVNEIVKKFSSKEFVIMLFHYDGIVDKWRDFKWSDTAIHVSAINQTKWWYAKRFLHPDIVAEYKYIFLWDEDLGVEHFHPGRYLAIIEREGLEISQPALDTSKSQVHHRITARWSKGDVHRRIYNYHGRGTSCDGNSTGPPCTGWVEMMAPVFSRAAWRCVWHMIQNDLIHAWGLDMKLGYCAQGNRSKNVGVVDSEFIIHRGLPTLGGVDSDKINAEITDHSTQTQKDKQQTEVHARSPTSNNRYAVRHRSYAELKIFHWRWNQAVGEDKCWIDPYAETRKE